MTDETTPDVAPWLWRTASSGQPLTERSTGAGAVVGVGVVSSSATGLADVRGQPPPVADGFEDDGRHRTAHVLQSAVEPSSGV